MRDAVDAAEKIRQWEDHMMTQDALEKHLDTNLQKGLTGAAASKLLERGKNALTERGKVPKWQIFLKEQTGMFSLLLWVAGILCFFAYIIQEDKVDRSNLFLGIVLVVVVFITGCFSYSQTSNAANLMEDFKNFIPQKALVLRDGEKKKIDAVNLVVGDVIDLIAGDAVPADVILLKTNEMKVNNASLTGESEDLLRNENAKVKNIFESPNVAFFGTLCTGGTGTGVVFRTGDDTVIGRIANLSQSAEKKQTPLSSEIDRFIFIITGVAVVLGVSFFCFGWYSGFDIVKNLVFAIGIIVANVPEGLLATVTVSLALTAKRMAGKYVLVKNMESVETLGSTSCICSDKTGTLTQNRMTVSQIYVNGKNIDASVNLQVSNELYKKEVAKGQKGDPDKVAKPEYSQQDPMFMMLVQAIALTTTSFFGYTPSDDVVRNSYIKEQKLSESDIPTNTVEYTPQVKLAIDEHKAKMIEEEKKKFFIKREVQGDASETGLVKFAMPILMKQYGGEYENGLDDIRREYPIITHDGQEATIPFSSSIKFNGIIRDMNKNVVKARTTKDNATFFMKGAPERVLERCKYVIENGVALPYNAMMQKKVKQSNDLFGGQGERVLAFARHDLDANLYPKDSHPFDVKTWKTWQEAEGVSDAYPGFFPMWDMSLIGLVSLNDPPRPKVDISVSKCRDAGIQVIMVTGDQPPTAAAIAAKVNIIRNEEMEYAKLLEKYEKEGMESQAAKDRAFAECESIVIHGDTLAKIHASEDALEDDEPEKGRIIMDWIRKPEVVFARTTPS
jgi:sodium/potassium-transporting ATPase subunit alpha